VTVSSTTDRQRKVEWPRKRTLVGRGHDEEENMERNAFCESIKVKAEEMELKRASWGSVSDKRMWAQPAPSIQQHEKIIV
jgi:hypothetical protein